MINNKEFRETVERIAVKYAKEVEKRIDRMGNNSLKNLYDEIQLLGNMAATLERLSRTEK